MMAFSAAIERGEYELAALRLLLAITSVLEGLDRASDGAAAVRDEMLQGGGVRLHVDYADLVYRKLHDLAETPRIAFGDGGGERSGVALQLERDPLLRKAARKRLIRSATLRRRDRLILRLLSHHTGVNFDGARTDISWRPVFPRDPAALIAGFDASRVPDSGRASHRGFRSFPST
jgi:hypothetical protein